jgi:hypothetical protein
MDHLNLSESEAAEIEARLDADLANFTCSDYGDSGSEEEMDIVPIPDMSPYKGFDIKESVYWKDYVATGERVD